MMTFEKMQISKIAKCADSISSERIDQYFSIFRALGNSLFLFLIWFC